jgi:hypothetical protein
VKTPTEVQDCRHANEASDAIPEVPSSIITIQLVDTVIAEFKKKFGGVSDVGKIHALGGKHHKRASINEAAIHEFCRQSLPKP